jgi:hypothetical protein
MELEQLEPGESTMFSLVSLTVPTEIVPISVTDWSKLP